MSVLITSLLTPQNMQQQNTNRLKVCLVSVELKDRQSRRSRQHWHSFSGSRLHNYYFVSTSCRLHARDKPEIARYCQLNVL